MQISAASRGQCSLRSAFDIIGDFGFVLQKLH
jgi:hypothetical protein